MTIEIVFAFVIGCVIGALSNRKDKDVEDPEAVFEAEIAAGKQQEISLLKRKAKI